MHWQATLAIGRQGASFQEELPLWRERGKSFLGDHPADNRAVYQMRITDQRERA